MNQFPFAPGVIEVCRRPRSHWVEALSRIVVWVACLSAPSYVLGLFVRAFVRGAL